MRDRVQISVDSSLKRAYEDLFGKEYSKLLEEAMKKKLIGSNSVEAYEAVIRIVDAEQEERRQRLAQLKVDVQQIPEKTRINPELEKKREEIWKQESSWLEKQIIRMDPNWNRIMWIYEFDSKKEAMAWFKPHINVNLNDKSKEPETPRKKWKLD